MLLRNLLRFGRKVRFRDPIFDSVEVALIAVVCIAAVTLLGKSASRKFSSVASAIS